MKLDESKHSIANLRDMLARGDLVANREYQRAPGLWPVAARSYFIDTLLEGFPISKVYFHEFLDRTTKKVKTEIVDGQQRITTIQDFLNDKFALGKNSLSFAGRRFSDLDEDRQESFLFYTLSADVIRDARRPEILQMFRRMNAYTLPLNAAEKRHSDFFGLFKDMVTRVLDRVSLLPEWEVFTTRQTVRMADAAFIADLVLAMEEGVVSTSDSKLHSLYKRFDRQFPEAEKYEEALIDIFRFIGSDLSGIRGSNMTKPFALYALFCALYHNSLGLPGFQKTTGVKTIGNYVECSPERATSNLLQLADAEENKDSSRFPDYVAAMSAGSNREKQRTLRICILCHALRGQL